MEQPNPSETRRYRAWIAGRPSEPLTLAEIRQKIRSGEITSETDVSAESGDEWGPASAHPDMFREFLSSPAQKARATSAGPAIEPMRTRAFAALSYGFRGHGLFAVFGVAAFLLIPGFGLLANLYLPGLLLTVVRHSARGEKEMPGWSDYESSGHLEAAIRSLAVTLISLLPVIAWYAVGISGSGLAGLFTPAFLAGLAVALLVTQIYYPACLATLAVWDSILDSLNPSYVLRVLRHLGSDYVWVVAAFLVAGGLRFFAGLLPFVFGIPLLGPFTANFLSIAAAVSAAHLLGWAIHRHAEDLGCK